MEAGSRRPIAAADFVDRIFVFGGHMAESIERFYDPLPGFTGCFFIRTPGWSPPRNSTPARSRVAITFDSVEVREPISPSKDSMRRIVPLATRACLASSICSMPTRPRAALSCLPVINQRP